MATHLTEGQKAPAFTGKDQMAKKISLKDFIGQKLVLYFTPRTILGLYGNRLATCATTKIC